MPLNDQIEEMPSQSVLNEQVATKATPDLLINTTPPTDMEICKGKHTDKPEARTNDTTNPTKRMTFLDTLVVGNTANNEPEGSQVTVQQNMISYEQENETNNYPNPEFFILITSSDKERIYKNWTNALIIKMLGKRVGYQFLQKKLRAIWKPTETLSLVDLGCDYYLIKFAKEENYNKTLHEGPWFIGNQSLTVRKWEPRFVASKAALTYSAIWARLPELSNEFYDYDIL
uniref:Uncharacterized protein LOC104222393 n=1 Tax=Nicotiana sylvestris TaxID=4096 RepID=A0A1U7VVU8_NICSY|nr:PREDICTED: uncharacterized protein LOC104222393 [Nicotiana sylvestris]